MSQKTKRASVSLEEKSRTDSPVREMKKKAAAEKERAEKEREEKKTDKPAGANQNKLPPAASEKNGKPAPASEKKKETEKPNESSEKKSMSESPKSTEVKQNGSKTPANGAEKATNGAEKPTNGAEKAAKGTEKATKGAEKATDSTEKQSNSVEKGSGAEKADKQALNGTNNGSVEKSGETIELDVEQEDEQFPELAYDDGSDDDPTPAARSVTRRSQVKAARTPETPHPASNKASAEDKTADVPPTSEKESKLLKMGDDFTASSMKLRSADPVTDNADESKTEDEEGKSAADESMTVKTDTNFSKSRIKVSPYRRSTRLQDSLVANYTGNNTTMEMDISETSAPGSADDSTHVSRRSIRGRRSYKTLGQFVPSPRRTDITIGADFRPTVHVVGRKRKTAEDDEDTDLELPSTLEELAAPEAPVKRMRLFERVVTPFSSLLRRRTVASSTPLPLRRSQAIVGINSDLPLHGDVQIAPEALPVTPAPESELLKSMPVEVAEIATESQDVQTRQKCAVM